MSSGDENEINDNGKDFNYPLLDNAIHSYNHGKDKLKKYQEKQDQWDLKEAILFIHNGMELFLKYILAQHNEFLIFDNVDKAANAKIRARERDIDIFELKPAPNTVKFSDAVSRVKAIYDGKKANFFDKLIELNGMRNQIEHYGGGLNGTKVYELLDTLSDMTTSFLSAYNIKTPSLFNTFSTISSVSHSILNETRHSERRSFRVINKFNGQLVDGKLFGHPNEQIYLPKFDKVLRQIKSQKNGTLIDIVGLEKSGHRWVIEVKSLKKVNARTLLATFAQVINKSGNEDTIWIMNYGDFPNDVAMNLIDKMDLRKKSPVGRKLYFSTLRDIQKIENILRIPSGR